ncbi:hypothetical protein ACYSNW_05610 [Enterococcus sp. LJL99]
MKGKYEEELSKIKAPRELIERTKNEVRKEMIKKEAIDSTSKQTNRPIIKINFRYMAIVSAAVLVIVIGVIKTQNNISVQEIAETNVSLNPTFGRRTEQETKVTDSIKLISSKEKTIIPDFLQEVKASKVKGHQILIAKDKLGNYYAGYEVNGTYYYVTGTKVTEKEFVEYLKNKF